MGFYCSYSLMLFCSPVHVHFSTIKHLLLFWFLRRSWQNSHRCFLESLKPFYHSGRGPPYHRIIHALQTVLHLNKKICLMYNYRVYNNLFWIFLIQMEYRLQSMHNHMVGRAASVVSPFYSILLGNISFSAKGFKGTVVNHKYNFSIYMYLLGI